MKKTWKNKSSDQMNDEERIEWLKYSIQKNFDDENWYGYNAKKKLFSIAAQVELLGKGIVFTPQYNCPA